MREVCFIRIKEEVSHKRRTVGFHRHYVNYFSNNEYDKQVTFIDKQINKYFNKNKLRV